MPSKPYAAIILAEFCPIAETLMQQASQLFPIKSILRPPILCPPKEAFVPDVSHLANKVHKQARSWHVRKTQGVRYADASITLQLTQTVKLFM